MAQRRANSKLPEGLALLSAQSCAGEALVDILLPWLRRKVWKSSLAAPRQLGSVTVEKWELLVFPTPQCVCSGTACQGPGLPVIHCTDSY